MGSLSVKTAERVPPRMSRSGLVFLGIMTSVPLVIPITVLAVALLQSAFAPSNEGFTVPVGFACLYWSGLFVLPVLTLYYCVNAYNEPLFSRDRKLAAVAVVFFGGLLGQAAYYVLWLVMRHPLILGKDSPGAPPPETILADGVGQSPAG